MSFILDALRKSEIERQRQSGPSIAEFPVAREDRRLPVALLAIGLLLAVNVGVLLFFLMRDAGTPAADTAAAAASATPAVAMPGPAPAAPAATDVPVGAADTGAASAPLPEPAITDPATLPPAAPDPTLLPDTPAGAPGARVTYSESPVPSATSLPSMAAGLPSLSVDLHIFTDDPARRAVFINGRRYAQGETIAEGPRVEEITRDGAILNYRGQRFLLPRM